MASASITTPVKNPRFTSNVPFPNVSLDLWSDATMRSFLGVIIRGINDEWEMVRLQFYLRIQYKFILEKK